MSQGMWTFLGIMAVGYVIEKMSWSGSLLVMILSPRGIVIFSLIGGVVMIGLGWHAVWMIVTHAPRYRDEATFGT